MWAQVHVPPALEMPYSGHLLWLGRWIGKLGGAGHRLSRVHADLDGLLSHQGMLSYRGWWSSGGRAARGSWGGQGCVLTLTCHTHPPTSQQQLAKPTGEDLPKTRWELIRMQAGIIPVLKELRSWLGRQHINISKNWKNLHGLNGGIQMRQFRDGSELLRKFRWVIYSVVRA